MKGFVKAAAWTSDTKDTEEDPDAPWKRGIGVKTGLGFDGPQVLFLPTLSPPTGPSASTTLPA